MLLNKKTGKIFGDILWSTSAIFVLNGVLQLLIYPMINRTVTTEQFGNILYLQAIISIFAASVGSAANNIRVVSQKEKKASTGDFWLSIILLGAFGILLTTAFIQGKYFDLFDVVLYCILFIFTVLKYYLDVEFRLNFRYKNYFIYYFVSAIGYIVGLGILQIIHRWLLVFITGEAFAIIYYLVDNRNRIQNFKLSDYHKSVLKNITYLWISYLFYNGVINLDRVLLNYLLGGEYVTVYYVASLLGKMIALVVGPLNTILISYLSKEKKMRTQVFLMLSGAAIALGGIFYVLVQFITPLYVKIVYPDIYTQVIPLSYAANLSQILCFSGSLILTMVLTVANPKWQVAVQGGYAVIYIALAYFESQISGLEGFTKGAVTAGAVRLIAAVLLGIFFTRHNKKEKDNDRQEKLSM